MSVPVFIGDEVTAAGYRLAGARILTPVQGEVTAEFRKALEHAQLVFITAGCAAELAEQGLNEAIRSADPLVLVVPDAAGRAAPPDLDRQIDRVLGIDQ